MITGELTLRGSNLRLRSKTSRAGLQSRGSKYNVAGLWQVRRGTAGESSFERN